jgi:hypothetical protein
MRTGVCLLAAISWLSWISSLSADGDLDAAADRSAIEVKNPLADPTLFPIAVWLQDPNQAGKYIRDQGSCPPGDGGGAGRAATHHHQGRTVRGRLPAL